MYHIDPYRAHGGYTQSGGMQYGDASGVPASSNAGGFRDEPQFYDISESYAVQQHQHYSREQQYAHAHYAPPSEQHFLQQQQHAPPAPAFHDESDALIPVASLPLAFHPLFSRFRCAFCLLPLPSIGASSFDVAPCCLSHFVSMARHNE